MTEVWKFGVLGLQHFHRPCHVTEFPFQKLQYAQKDRFFCCKRKRVIIGTRSDDEESTFNKSSGLFYPLL